MLMERMICQLWGTYWYIYIYIYIEGTIATLEKAEISLYAMV
jgi:hypothetical protein